MAAFFKMHQSFLPASAAAAVAAITAAASATATATTAAAASATTIFHRARFVDHDRSAAEICLVQFSDCLLRSFVIIHFDEPEAFAASGFTIRNDFGARYFAISRKYLSKLVVVRSIRKSADINLHHAVKNIRYKKRMFDHKSVHPSTELRIAA